jgi:16S rRNA (guanine1207-N2)-methyltransferase
MSRRKRNYLPLSQRPVPDSVRSKLRAPLAIVLGSPAEVAHLLETCPLPDTVCYQMDLYQADRLGEELAARNLPGRVVTVPDLWDLPGPFQSVAYMPPRRGERELKIDMVEQAFHILRQHGTFVVWSPHETDPFFQTLLKKIFRRVHIQPEESDTVLWSQRDGDRPRRRHEVNFQAKIAGGASCRFVSRPGVFSYGRFDDGARALAEVMEIDAGDRVVDVGCGCGTDGIYAALQAGPEGHIAFVDSNVRAVALAELNARANGVNAFAAVASSTIEGLSEGSFDVALANPPYYANNTIAQLFIERSRALLKPQGRFYLVSKQTEQMAALIEATFGAVSAVMRRGYTVFCA